MTTLLIPDEAPYFSLNGLKKKAKVVNVYDGDTFKCIFWYNDAHYKFKCRMLGINAPELRKANPDSYKSRDALRELINNQIVSIEIGKFDCFGRLLVTVYKDDQNVNKYMLENNYAKEYKK